MTRTQFRDRQTEKVQKKAKRMVKETTTQQEVRERPKEEENQHTLGRQTKENGEGCSESKANSREVDQTNQRGHYQKRKKRKSSSSSAF